MKRDPRVDPRPGDVLIYGPQWQRERLDVIRLYREDVEYKVGSDLTYCNIVQWRDWMRNAEVIHVAD